MKAEAARVASGEDVHEGFGTKLARTLLPDSMGPRRPTSGAKLQALQVQRDLARQDTVEKYLRDHPEAGASAPKYHMGPRGEMLEEPTTRGGQARVVHEGEAPTRTGTPHYVLNQDQTLVDASALPQNNGVPMEQAPVPTSSPPPASLIRSRPQGRSSRTRSQRKLCGNADLPAHGAEGNVTYDTVEKASGKVRSSGGHAKAGKPAPMSPEAKSLAEVRKAFSAEIAKARPSEHAKIAARYGPHTNSPLATDGPRST